MNIHLRIQNYITRYAPSRTKIRDYLVRKKVKDPDTLLDTIGYNEMIMIDVWMRTWIAVGKSMRDIQQKLRQKGFAQDLIADKIAQYESEIMDWDEQSRAIIHQIETLRGRGKSLQYIEFTLRDRYPYFKSEIHEHISSLSEGDTLHDQIEKLIPRYSLQDQKDVQRLYAALMRKGFHYADIKTALKEVQDKT